MLSGTPAKPFTLSVTATGYGKFIEKAFLSLKKKKQNKNNSCYLKFENENENILTRVKRMKNHVEILEEERKPRNIQRVKLLIDSIGIFVFESQM